MSMNFVTYLFIYINSKNEIDVSIYVIIYLLTNILHYKLLKETINTPNLAKVIFKVTL